MLVRHNAAVRRLLGIVPTLLLLIPLSACIHIRLHSVVEAGGSATTAAQIETYDWMADDLIRELRADLDAMKARHGDHFTYNVVQQGGITTITWREPVLPGTVECTGFWLWRSCTLLYVEKFEVDDPQDNPQEIRDRLKFDPPTYFYRLDLPAGSMVETNAPQISHGSEITTLIWEGQILPGEELRAYVAFRPD